MDTRIDDDHEKPSESSPTMDPSPRPTMLDAGDNRLRLQVGERCFTTYASTLTTESPYFASFLSDHWQQAQADGTYFVNADGDLFSHILRYLRSATLPVIYSTLTGHDYGTYHALLREAEYFGIERLVTWLRNREYETVVTVEHSVLDFEGLGEMRRTYHSNVQLEYHPSWKTRRVYVCPRGIPVHRGSPGACGRLCQKVRGDAEDEYVEEEELRTVVISRRTMLNNHEQPPRLLSHET